MPQQSPADRVRKLKHEIRKLERRELELRFERARVAAYARADGMTLEQLAAAFGATASTVSYWVSWAELIELVRDELQTEFLCSYYAVAGLINGDYTNDELISIVEKASGWASKDGQITERDVWEVVARDPSFRRRYGSVPGLVTGTRRRRP